MTKYLIRLDDASPTMVYDKWVKVYGILKKHGIMPLVGVIPKNEDPTQKNSIILDFWEMMRQWQSSGTIIALHGYNHCYISSDQGVNPLWRRSEFAGVMYDVQKQKIEDGYCILKENGLNPTVFFAPSHTYDENTLKCLEKYTPIRIVSDTIAFYPYKEGHFIFIPQQLGAFRKIMLPGTWTFCFHPNTMTYEAIEKFDVFIEKNCSKFISFKDLNLENVGKKTFFDRWISAFYFWRRNMRQSKKK